MNRKERRKIIAAGDPFKQEDKMERKKPGDILRYVRNIHTSPRRKPGEILVHNRVAHLAGTGQGFNGFRYFICKGGRGHGWEQCPCGWRPDWGKHYAEPEHVKYQRERIAAGKPLTMRWGSLLPLPDGFKRVGKDMIAEADAFKHKSTESKS
jgi:hypothetical protein